MQTYELLRKLIAWEKGELDDDEESVIELFQQLIDEGIVWEMPGYYPRMAKMLIERGHCHKFELRAVK